MSRAGMFYIGTRMPSCRGHTVFTFKNWKRLLDDNFFPRGIDMVVIVLGNSRKIVDGVENGGEKSAVTKWRGQETFRLKAGRLRPVAHIPSPSPEEDADETLK